MMAGAIRRLGQWYSIPLMLLLMRLIDPVRWELAIPISILVPAGMWWLLKHALGIQLPSGMFEIG